MIDDTALFQLVGNAIKDVIANVFFVRQNLMDSRGRPGAAEIVHDPFLVELQRDFAL